MDKHTILIVDDEPHILSSLKKILEDEDREIFTANDAEEAWKILGAKGEVEVIICDNKLPGVLGIDFLIKVKRLHPDTIRILITGYPDLGSAIDAINRAHIWRYLLKPIEVEELKMLANQAFEYHRVLRENRLLLQIARQQSQWLEALKKKHPQTVSQELGKSKDGMDEVRVSEIIEAIKKKYYPDKREE